MARQDQDDMGDNQVGADMIATGEADDLSTVERPDEVAQFWYEAGIDPVEIALPDGVGFTLRLYRPREIPEPDTNAKTDSEGSEDSDEPAAHEAKAEESTVSTEDSEEPVFLAHDGTLLLFKTPTALIDFVRSPSAHDLADVEGWSELVRDLTPELIVPEEADRYSLDLVVENLRGGHDAWDPELVISAGEIARDIAFACHLDDVAFALAPGSPLDDLDEGLRTGGFLARRRLKKIGVEQAALGWRTVIGKISTAVEWQ